MGVLDYFALETGDINRFAKAGNYASYCRAVTSRRESNGKKKGVGKLQQALGGLDNMFKLAKKYKAKIVFGTDLLFDYEGRKHQLRDLTQRKPWFTSAEIMIQATGNAADCVALSGKRNIYGKLGVIEEGAMADVLIYDKNLLEDVEVVEKHQEHLKLIVKDGKVYKNEL